MVAPDETPGPVTFSDSVMVVNVIERTVVPVAIAPGCAKSTTVRPATTQAGTAANVRTAPDGAAALVVSVCCDSAISIQPSTYWVEAEPRMSGSVRTSASARTFWPTGTPWIWVDAFTEACTTDPALTMCAAGMV